MRLKSVSLTNFRSYLGAVTIPLGALTTFVGRNDIGKSSILEALEIFFNEELVKMDRHDSCKSSGDAVVRIGCVFDQLPDEVVIDSNFRTRLQDEFLLNADGCLEIHKVYDCGGKTKITPDVICVAHHPSAEGYSDLLQLKNADLKKRAKELEVETKTLNLAVNSSIRQAVWSNCLNLELARTEIPIAKLTEDKKELWSAIQKLLPQFALFQSDRPSRDNDDEVQDPLAIAVKSAIAEVQDKLQNIQDIVRAKATEVAVRTLAKLNELDSRLATELSPVFTAEPKWDGFKLSLHSDNGIPVNKRGSGVRRLILLSFFRAEAERKSAQSNGKNVIYAIEEPETSQHPNNQKLLIDTLQTLASEEDTQVILTTHNPAFAGFLPSDSIRFVTKIENTTVVEHGDEILPIVTKELGVLPDNRVQVIVCVEGPHDIRFLKHVSRRFHSARPELPDLSSDPRVEMIFLGGSTLQYWVQNNCLTAFNRPQLHLYDRDAGSAPKYQEEVDLVNGRNDGSFAASTRKREIENYLHPQAIADVLGVAVTFGEMDSVPEAVAAAIHNVAPDAAAPWELLETRARETKQKKAKTRLNDAVAAAMTIEQIREADTHGDLEEFFEKLAEMLGDFHPTATGQAAG